MEPGYLKYVIIAAVFLAVYLAVGSGLLRLRHPLPEFFGRWLKQVANAPNWANASLSWRHMPKPMQGVLLAGAASLLLAVLWVWPGLLGVGLLLAGLGWLGQCMVRAWFKQRRLKALEAQLPEVLELVVSSMRAGLSLAQALENAGREVPQPMASEFTLLLRDCRLGMSPEDALGKFLLRWPNRDLELFVIAAGVSLRTGGNLAEVTDRLVATIRERFRLRGRIAALTAQGRLSGWVVGVLPLILLAALTLLDAEMMSAFFRHPLGWLLLAVGLVMELLGAFFIRRIVRIDE